MEPVIISGAHGFQKLNVPRYLESAPFYVVTLTAAQHPSDLHRPANPCIVFPCRHEPDGTTTNRNKAAKTPENQG
ncbi:hypothetical protein, partial [Glutamicibacter protophormiae]